MVGHNDIDMAAHVKPALSSCRPPNYEMGKLAVDMLLDIASGHGANEYSLTRVECQLVVRASVASRRRVKPPRLDTDAAVNGHVHRAAARAAAQPHA